MNFEFRYFGGANGIRRPKIIARVLVWFGFNGWCSTDHVFSYIFPRVADLCYGQCQGQTRTSSSLPPSLPCLPQKQHEIHIGRRRINKRGGWRRKIVQEITSFVSPVLVTAGVSVVFSFCQTEKYFPGAFEGGEKRRRKSPTRRGGKKNRSKMLPVLEKCTRLPS